MGHARLMHVALMGYNCAFYAAPEWACGFTCMLCMQVDFIHRKGKVNRDIKLSSVRGNVGKA